jgi:hypothetical protein
MSDLKERLDQLKNLIQERDFLEGKGLSNEVNIRIFCYDAAEEMTVQHFISQIKADPSIGCNLIECNLYKTFLSICDDLDITETIPEMEEDEGEEFLLEQLLLAVKQEDFIEKIKEGPNGEELNGQDDVLLITGVGDAFPFMRVHNLLESLQPHFPDIPILVMYPGTFNGRSVRLFDKLKPSPYYRAFNVI